MNEAVKKVTEYRLKNPTASIEKACMALGVSKSSYYLDSKRRSTAKAKAKESAQQYTKVEAKPRAKAPAELPAMAGDIGKLFMIVGTPEQIRGMLK